MDRYLLGKRNAIILNVISNNARLSYNQIGRITHISKDSVRDRIQKMKNEKFILSFFPLINYSKLNLDLFHFYIRLNSLRDFQKYYEKKLANTKGIVSITWLLGKYDVEIQIINKNKRGAMSILRTIIPDGEIVSIKILKSDKLKIYTMGINNKQDNRLIPELDNKKSKKLDKHDLKLINLLAKDARIKIIEVSQILNIDPDNIRYRIKRLLNEKIIHGFYTRTNKHRCGLNTYLLLLKVKKKMTNDDLLKLEKIDNLFYIKECTQIGNYILRFHASDNKELINVLTLIRDTLNPVNLDVHTLLERRKFLPF